MVESKLAVEVRDVYGVRKAYPANPAARKVADLLGMKTLPVDKRAALEALGFEFELVNVASLKGVA